MALTRKAWAGITTTGAKAVSEVTEGELTPLCDLSRKRFGWKLGPA